MDILDHIHELRAELAVAIDADEIIWIKKDLDAALQELAEQDAAYVPLTGEPPC